MTTTELPTGLYVTEENEKPVTQQYLGDVDRALRLAAFATELGLSWSLYGYDCPTDDENETVREYRLTVWREVKSETLTWVPDPTNEADG